MDTIQDDEDDGGDCGTVAGETTCTGSGETACTASGIIGCGAIASVVFGILEMIVLVILAAAGTVTLPCSMVIGGTTAVGGGTGSGCFGGFPVVFP